MVLEIGQWSAEETIFSKNNAHNPLDLEPLTRVRLMLHQSQAPITGRPTLHAVEINALINIFCAENLFHIASLLYLLK